MIFLVLDLDDRGGETASISGVRRQGRMFARRIWNVVGAMMLLLGTKKTVMHMGCMALMDGCV